MALAENHSVYLCSSGCGYVEHGRVWDSPPYGRDGQLRCPDCGAQVWDYRDITSEDAKELVNQGYARVERFYRL